MSLVSFDQNDPSINHAVSNPAMVKNNAGVFGAYLSGLLVDIFGFAAMVWPLVFIAWGAGCVSTWFTIPWWRWSGFMLLAACLISLGAAWDLGLGDVRGGGMLGMTLYTQFTTLFSPVGSTLIWLFLLFISIELAFGIAWLNLVRTGWELLRQTLSGTRLSIDDLPDRIAAISAARKAKKEKGEAPEAPENELKAETESSPAVKTGVIPLFDIHDDEERKILKRERPLDMKPLDGEPVDPRQSRGQDATLSMWEPTAVTKPEESPETFTFLPTPPEQPEKAPSEGVSANSANPLLALTLPEKIAPGSFSQISTPELSLNAAIVVPHQESSAETSPQSSVEKATSPVPSAGIAHGAAFTGAVAPAPVSRTAETPRENAASAVTPIQSRPGLHRRKLPLPSVELLQAPQQSDSLPSPEVLAEQSASLMQCLAEFNIQGELVKVTPGPVITLFEIRPAPGVRVGRFTNLTDDLARSLKAEAIRIQAPVPGCDTVGVEIPNLNRSTVNFRELIQSEAFQKNSSLLTMALGKDIEGRPSTRDLATMPHVLVAGTTGSGKSVCLNSVLVSFLYKASPDELKLMLIDPKRVEMAMYADLPHLVHPVVTETSLAKTALEWAVAEMDKRYDCLAKFGVKNIKDYNKKLALFGGQKPEEYSDLDFLPYLVIVIDELADLMLTAGKDVEGCIVRLAQLARAAGIHLIVATQRPSVDVVTGLIKANFPCRISFQVANKYDSRTILDAAGAEQLLGKGDMLFKPTGGKLIRMHGPFVTDDEVQAVVEHWKRQRAPSYEVDFTEWGASVAESAKPAPTASGNGSDEDALYAEAVAFVQEQGRMSISLLQRRFRIGFNKAARFVERMEEEGILPPASRANKARTVRMD